MTLARLTLQRAHEDDTKTLGAIYNEQGRREVVTLEPPAHASAHDKGRIPAGEYVCERHYSPEHRRVVFWILDVPGRGEIEIHIGCLPRDTKGCVLVGLEYGDVDYGDGTPDGKGPGILASKAAFLSFMADHPEQRFSLTVIDPLPEHHV